MTIEPESPDAEDNARDAVAGETPDSDLERLAPADPGMTTDRETIPCPYCGEINDLFLEPDVEQPAQEFIEECTVCGGSYAVTVEYDDAGRPRIHAERLT